MSRRAEQAEATRVLILDAAEHVFAAHGYAGTSMRGVARAAGTSQALLHHHFGTKQGLYESVKERFTQRYREIPTPNLSAENIHVPFIRDVMLGYLRFLEQHPTAHRLRQWARLEGDDRPWGDEDEVWRHMYDKLTEVRQ